MLDLTLFEGSMQDLMLNLHFREAFILFKHDTSQEVNVSHIKVGVSYHSFSFRIFKIKGQAQKKKSL